MQEYRHCLVLRSLNPFNASYLLLPALLPPSPCFLPPPLQSMVLRAQSAAEMEEWLAAIMAPLVDLQKVPADEEAAPAAASAEGGAAAAAGGAAAGGAGSA